MATSIVEKYELILAADPRSRIFVELAKALVERGDFARAAEVCRKGLEHHPSSVLGRVTWGRALLESGDRAAALEQFATAIGLDSVSPYAFNLVGEALVKEGMWREALPILERAAALQPADTRIRGWLDEARRNVQEAGAAAGSGNGVEATEGEGAAAPSGSGGSAAAGEDDGETTEPNRPIAAAATAPSAGESAAAGAASAEPARPDPSTGSGEGRAPAALDVAAGAANLTDAAAPVPPGATPPPRPPPVKREPEEREVTDPRFVLSMIPGEGRDENQAAAQAQPRAGTPAEAAEAARLAEQYERELREKLMSAPEPPPGFLRRHRRAVIATAVLIAAAGGGAVFWKVRSRVRLEEAAHAGRDARAGLARDTLAALRKASEVLASAREISRADPKLASLAVQVAAVLASDYGDERARGLARTLAATGTAGEGALAARLLCADDKAEREEAEKEILAAPPGSSPLLQALAGEALLRRGEIEAGRGKLESAAQANPPLLRAIADLGDAALAAGDAEGALTYYSAAITAHSTHARSVIGAAEARLALKRDLDVSRKEIASVDADPGSAPPDAAAVRFEIAAARVIAAGGAAADGAARLSRASEKLGLSAPLAAASAEIRLAAREWDRAETDAARAVDLAPKDASYRVLLARARIGRGKLAEALTATAGSDERAIHVQRAIARYGLGQYREAKAELDKTRSADKKMPAEAAVWYALCDVALGKAAKAEGLLSVLVAVRAPPPLSFVALGRAQEAQGKLDEAEQSYRSATEKDDRAPEGFTALGKLLLARGKPKEAAEPLERAVKLDPLGADGRLALAEARLAADEPAAARAELDAVLLARPRDGRALRALTEAYLAEHQPDEARRAAERAMGAEPRDPASWICAAKAALAQGDAATALRMAGRASKMAGKGPRAAEARKLLAEASGRK